MGALLAILQNDPNLLRCQVRRLQDHVVLRLGPLAVGQQLGVVQVVEAQGAVGLQRGMLCCSLRCDGRPKEEHHQSEQCERYARGGKDEANAPKLGQHRAQWRRHQKKGVLDPTGRSEDAPQ